MKICITGDFYEDAGITSLVFDLEKLTHFFARKKYGSASIEIFAVIICVPYELKQRIRYVKKENVLYYDIIIDYAKIKKAKLKEKKEILAQKIITSFEILNKYRFGLNTTKLVKDADLFFNKIDWKNSDKE